MRTRLIAQIGADQRDCDDVALQKTILVSIVLSSAFVAAIWGSIYIAAGAQTAGAIPTAYSALSLSNTALFGAFRCYGFYRSTQLALILLLPWLMTIVLGSFNNSSAVIVWSTLCPLGALVVHDHRAAIGWLLVFLLLLAASALLQSPGAPSALSPLIIILFFSMNIGGVLIIVFCMLYYFIDRKNNFQLRSEMLLLNILPIEISNILKGEPRTIANQYDEASILFADVVRFTTLAQSMSPIELVELLDEVFMCFDFLVDKYHLEKIKTIGDCYMVVSGVPRQRADHAHALARFALDMQACVAAREFHGRRLTFRIGMNSGPVVAGVIGRKKFIYDLWGDAVNMASRMESQGQSETIQITHATYNIIKDDFVCEARGSIKVKGSGEMQIWHVLSEKTKVMGLDGTIIL
ncbi:adenylate/guanylate cyclase domain-containing protein [Methylobacterium sp. J-070]|uniref:adenylate/guanylate cyclase domain-containing protein n=1 Tax=Methylobacterium sp. J-070 TaxID=2836650 RepID=UPI001FBBE2A7|nr:adenylate/guanylate cyclase domain-containing protein [Methylobacterium sp. J-070]MCJ2049494.1 adenylate/guanylate cyclase domain-containing protein [Methylobacterium sp. J-070]